MTVSDDDAVCRIEKVGKVLIITLARPNQRNALNYALRQALRDAFDMFEAESNLACAVLTGEGTVFCAGGDLKEMARLKVQVPPEEWGLLLGSRGRVSKPVIAAVNGPAYAGGFRLAQECDLCLAAESASFAITEAKRGRGAPWAASLINMIPQRIMLELLATGNAISASRAYDVGLVNQVVPDNLLLETSVQLAQVIAGNAPLSVRAAKELVTISTEQGRTQALRSADLLYDHVYRSLDAVEGPRAFSERRAPAWRGQ
jgi:enoyl-CoA hydratase/carnithine racemase